MSTLTLGGRISIDIVDEEIERLNHSWSDPRTDEWEIRLRDLIGGDQFAEMDAFDGVQVSHVIEADNADRFPKRGGCCSARDAVAKHHERCRSLAQILEPLWNRMGADCTFRPNVKSGRLSKTCLSIL
jgi:hypothetical protein